MQLYSKYVVNKSTGEVQLIDGKVRIPLGGWRGLTTKELEHEDIVYALRRDWIELKDTQPTTPETPEKPALKMIDPAKDPYAHEEMAKVESVPANTKEKPTTKPKKV
jgi:hypothetical protein